MAHEREDIRRKKARALIARTGHSPIGGHFGAHDDTEEDRKLVEKAVHEHEAHMHPGVKETKLTGLKTGGAAHGPAERKRLDKRARGGSAPGKKGAHVSVIVMPQGGGAGGPPRPVPVPVPVGAGPGGPPMPPPRPPMGAGAPGAMPPPGVPGAGPMMRKRGGSAKRADGGLAPPSDAMLESDKPGALRAAVASKQPKDDYRDARERDAVNAALEGSRKRGGKTAHRDMGGAAPTMGMNGQIQYGPGPMMPVQPIAARPGYGNTGSPLSPQKRGGHAEKRARGGECEPRARGGQIKGGTEPGGPYRLGPGHVEGIKGGAGGGIGRIEKSEALPYAEDRGGRGRA
jgi:hypothetical protein